MSRVVITSAGTLGDFLPFIALAKSLKAHGHSVVMAVNPAMQTHCQKEGLEFAACGQVFGAEEVRARAEVFDYWHPVSFDHCIQYLKTLELPKTCRELASACKGADFMIASTIQGVAPFVFEMTNVPWISVSLNASDYPHASQPAAASQVPPSAKETEEHRTWLEFYNSVRQEIGLVPYNLEEWPEYLSARCAILASSIHFSLPELPKAPVTRQTGFWFHNADGTWEPPEDLKAFMESGEAPLALSLSSLPVRDPAHVVAVHAEAAARLGRRLLIQKGWAGLDASGLPSHLDQRQIFFAQYLPHDWLFARSVALIHHGGIGTIARALRHGLPMLVEPYGNDQFFNAQRILMLGVGAAMHPHKLTASGLERILKEKILLPQVRQQALEVGARIRAEDGLSQACDLVQQALKGHSWDDVRT